MWDAVLAAFAVFGVLASFLTDLPKPYLFLLFVMIVAVTIGIHTKKHSWKWAAFLLAGAMPATGSIVWFLERPTAQELAIDHYFFFKTESANIWAG